MRIVLTLLSAALYVLAFPPWNWGLLAWIALVPFFRALRGTSAGSAAGLGLLWGVAVIWGIGHWVPAALTSYWNQPSWFGFVFSMIGALVFVGSYLAGFGASAAWLSTRSRGIARIALLASTWVAWEVARGRLLTGDPWLLAGYALVPYPLLIQAADLGGVYLLSFLVAFVNAAVAEVIPAAAMPRPAPAWPALAVAAALLSATYLYGTWRLHTPLSGGPPVRIAIVQGNNDLGAQWRSSYYGRGLQDYLRLSAEAAARKPVDLLIWPESAVTFFLADEPNYRDRIVALLSAVDADLIVGAPRQELADPARPRFYNSAFYVTHDGVIAGHYDKVHLLPFGEYFPLRTIELLRRRFERVRTFTPGAAERLLQTRFGQVAVVICFEAIFPELVRQHMAMGAGWLVNLSNDAWLGDGAGPRQHAAMVALRAVENRTWVVRATTTGVSSIIDPFGRVVQQSDVGTAAILTGEVIPLHVKTIYQRCGDAFAAGCVLSAVLAVPLLRRRRRR